MWTYPPSTRRFPWGPAPFGALWVALLWITFAQLARSESSSPIEPSAWQRRQIAAAVKRSALDFRKQSEGAAAVGKAERAAYLLASSYVLTPSNDTLLAVARSCKSAGLDAEAQAIAQLINGKELTQDAAELWRALASEPPSPEQEAAQAEALRNHIRNATRSFDAGAFPLAAQELSLAFATKPLPRLLFNAAQSYRRTRQPELAYALLERYLTIEPSDADQSSGALHREARNTQRELLSTAMVEPVYRKPWLWGLISSGIAAIGVSAGLASWLSTGLKADRGPIDISFGSVHAQ